MCQRSSHIKLCTCGGMNFSKRNSWQLNKAAEQNHIDGVFVQTDGLIDLELDHLISERLLHDINNHEVFDFYYQPTDGDLLTINIEKRTYHFFNNGTRFVELEDREIQWKGTHLRSGKIKI